MLNSVVVVVVEVLLLLSIIIVVVMIIVIIAIIIIAPAGFWPRGQNPRRHPRIPRVYTYKEFQNVRK